MAYKKPAYDLKTTGVYKFKTKDKEYILKVTYFERESDTQDSLAIQDDLRGELGSINIKNASWNKLSKGETIRAVSSKGDTGMLTRIDDISNFDKYEKGGGVGIDNFFVKNNFGHWSIIDRKTNKMVVGYSKKEDATITAKGLNDVSDASELNKIISKLKSMDGYGYFLNTMAHGGSMDSQQGIDLFEDYENIPANVQSVLDKYEDAFMDGDYKELKKALTQLKKIGYTFEYDLDGQAYDLRPIGTKGKSEMEDGEEYAKGGDIGDIKVGDIIYRAYFTDADGEKSSAIVVSKSKDEAEKIAEKIDSTFSFLSNPIKIKNEYILFEETRENEPIYKMSKGGSINAKSIFKEYEENENDNYHAENILLLANNFGTEEDVETAKEILKQRDKQGSMSEAMNKKSYELNKRLYPKLIDALNSNKNQTTMTQEHIDKFVRGANSTDETAREISTRKLKEAGLDKNGKPIESKISKPTTLGKKAKATNTSKAPMTDDDYDCDEIIAEALKRKKNAKKSAEKSANKPEVVKATKKVERTHDAIEKQIEAGKLKKAQIEKIIAETEDLLKMLKKALKSL